MNSKDTEESEKLELALSNNEESTLFDLTSSKIKTIKNNILQQLNLDREILKEYHKKLKDYRYVDEIPDLQYGNYIRWIPLKDPENIKLTHGGYLVNIDIIDGVGIYIKCKTIKNRFFHFHLDTAMVFQKLNCEEKIILKALDYISESK